MVTLFTMTCHTVPLEIWIQVAEYLSSDDLIALSQCSRELRSKITCDDIWKRRVEKRWFDPISETMSDTDNYFDVFMHRLSGDRWVQGLINQVSSLDRGSDLDVTRFNNYMDRLLTNPNHYLPQLLLSRNHLDRHTLYEDGRCNCDIKVGQLHSRLENLKPIFASSTLLEVIQLSKLWQGLDSISGSFEELLILLNLMDPNYYDLLPFRNWMINNTLGKFTAQGGSELPNNIEKVRLVRKCVRDYIQMWCGTDSYDDEWKRPSIEDMMILRNYAGDSKPITLNYNVMVQQVCNQLTIDVRINDGCISVKEYGQWQDIFGSDWNQIYPSSQELFHSVCVSMFSSSLDKLLYDSRGVRYVTAEGGERNPCRLGGDNKTGQVLGTMNVSSHVQRMVGLLYRLKLHPNAENLISLHRECTTDPLQALFRHIVKQRPDLTDLCDKQLLVPSPTFQITTHKYLQEDPLGRLKVGQFVVVRQTLFGYVVGFGKVNGVEAPVAALIPNGDVVQFQREDFQKLHHAPPRVMALAENDQLGQFFSRWTQSGGFEL